MDMMGHRRRHQTLYIAMHTAPSPPSPVARKVFDGASPVAININIHQPMGGRDSGPPPPPKQWANGGLKRVGGRPQPHAVAAWRPHQNGIGHGGAATGGLGGAPRGAALGSTGGDWASGEVAGPRPMAGPGRGAFEFLGALPAPPLGARATCGAVP